VRVYLGIPMYGGADAQFISSLVKSRVVLDRVGYEVETDIHNGCSVLPRARNEIVQRFLSSGFDVLVFIDADLAWNPVDLVRLIRSPHLFTAGVYRQKKQELVFNWNPAGEGKAEAVGAGFVALKREALEKMVAAYPQTHYEHDGKEYHALFDFDLHNGQYWGEDYTFCRRWRELGGEIDILPDVTIKHIGTYAYTGTL